MVLRVLSLETTSTIIKIDLLMKKKIIKIEYFDSNQLFSKIKNKHKVTDIEMSRFVNHYNKKVKSFLDNHLKIIEHLETIEFIFNGKHKFHILKNEKNIAIF